MAYELWDTESANLLRDYQTEEEALGDVLRLVQMGDAVTVESLALAYEDGAGETHPIAHGANLVERARQGAVRTRLAS